MKAFYYGHELPKYVPHTNLVLNPKKQEVKNFADMRLISLSSFLNKIISRMVYERMVKVLPKTISQN